MYKFLLTYLCHLTVFLLLSLHTKQSSNFARETVSGLSSYTEPL